MLIMELWTLVKSEFRDNPKRNRQTELCHLERVSDQAPAPQGLGQNPVSGGGPGAG